MTNVTAFGKEFPVVFNMAAQINYERITDKAFDLASLTHAENRLALYFAAIFIADENTDITPEMLLKEASMEDINAIDKAVNEEMRLFYHIPVPAKEEEPETEEGEASPN